ncbi:MAG: phosphatase PAP2 family protein [Saprospiraceae bacterium]
MHKKNLNTFNYIFLLSFLFCLIFSAPISGQSPYELSYKKDIPLFVIGLGGILSRPALRQTVDPFTSEDITLLNPNDINTLDRKFLYHYSANARDASDVFQISSFYFPSLLLLAKPVRKDILTIGVIGAEVFFCFFSITSLIKTSATRARPFVYDSSVPLEEKLRRSARLSFISGHTSRVAAFSFFTAKVATDYYPNSKWKPVIWTAATILPVTTGILRVKGGKHYPTDVTMGLVVGGLIGYFIPQLHKKRKNKNVDLSIFPTNDGMGLVLQW